MQGLNTWDYELLESEEVASSGREVLVPIPNCRLQFESDRNK